MAEIKRFAAAFLLFVAGCQSLGGQGDDWTEADARVALADVVREQIEDIGRTAGLGPVDERVIEAVRRVPRHAFTPESLRFAAYLDMPLQWRPDSALTQPSLIGLMAQLCAPTPDGRLLMVGSGSGYEAALLAELAHDVRVVEIDEEVAREAAARLAKLGYGNVRIAVADGYYGWPGGETFEAIVLRHAVARPPPPLLWQLAPGGRLVAPVGLGQDQQLTLYEKQADGSLVRRPLIKVRFSRLPGGLRI